MANYLELHGIVCQNHVNALESLLLTLDHLAQSLAAGPHLHDFSQCSIQGVRAAAAGKSTVVIMTLILILTAISAIITFLTICLLLLRLFGSTSCQSSSKNAARSL
jgi:hypothetical protein